MRNRFGSADGGESEDKEEGRSTKLGAFAEGAEGAEGVLAVAFMSG
jgi:hypothetical protein